MPVRSLSSRIHAHRAVGRDRDHLGLDRDALAGGAESPRGRGAHQLCQQPEADRPRDAQPPRYGRHAAAVAPAARHGDLGRLDSALSGTGQLCTGSGTSRGCTSSRTRPRGARHRRRTSVRRGAGPEMELSVYGDLFPVNAGGQLVHFPGGLADYAVLVDKTGHDEPGELCPNMSGSFEAIYGLKFSAFTDGLSNSLLVGEKHVPITKHGNGWWDCSTYDGEYPTCWSRVASRDQLPTTNPRDTAGSSAAGTPTWFCSASPTAACDRFPRPSTRRPSNCSACETTAWSHRTSNAFEPQRTQRTQSEDRLIETTSVLAFSLCSL